MPLSIKYCRLKINKKFRRNAIYGIFYYHYCANHNDILLGIYGVIIDIINSVRPEITHEQIRTGDMRDILGGRAILVQDFIDSIQCANHSSFKTLKFRILLLADIFKNATNKKYKR